MKRRRLAVLCLSFVMTIAGILYLRGVAGKMNLAEQGPEHEAIRSLKALRLAVVEYDAVNRRWPSRLEDALQAMPDHPMRALPPLPLPGAKWGYRPEDGHVFIDSPHTDSRGNAWSAY